MAYTISEELKKRITELAALYPEPSAALIPVLLELQAEKGIVGEEEEEFLSGQLKIPRARIHGVISFYTMFNTTPTGKFHLQLCRNLSCRMAGAPDLLQHLENTLNIKEGETTGDGLFTLSTVECLGSCGTAPVLAVNELFHEGMTCDKLDKLLAELRKQADRP